MSLRSSLCALVVGLSSSLLLSVADAKPRKVRKNISILGVGDVALNRSNFLVDPNGVLEGRSVLPWAELSSKIAGLINADLNFMNLETVVTERNDLPKGNKGQKSPFLFRTHPKGVEHLLSLGFNLISGANNHSYDYGEEGAKETVRHLQNLTEDKNSVVYAGIGLNDTEAARPATLSIKGAKVAFSSIGIVTNMLRFHRAGPNKAGTLGFRFAEDWERSLKALEEVPADLKIMSVHYGRERDIRTDDRQRQAFRHALGERGVDILFGHHAHVVRGIELHKGKPIFYGLGNFLIRGAANMGKKPELRTCCDYGLAVKVHMVDTAKGYELGAIEALPVYDMHRIAHPLSPQEGAKRIEVLNVLAESLDNSKVGSVGVRFSIRPNGTGLFCTAIGKEAAGEVGSLCKSYRGPSPVSSEVRLRVKRAPDPTKAKKKTKKKSKKKLRRSRRRR